MSPDMPWHAAAALVLAGVLLIGGVIAFIAGLRKDWHRQQQYNHFDGARTTQRQAFRDVRGVQR